MSAFKAWRPIEITKHKPSEYLKMYIKRLFVFFRSKGSYPVVKQNRVVLMFGENNKINTRDMYVLMEHYFGKDIFESNPDWNTLWDNFRRRVTFKRIVKVPVQFLFKKENGTIKLNEIYW